ncbi:MULTISPECIES: superoxide dismutase family protein [Rhizobium]|uniref:Superoxide dismutase [Cu-Zn] n=1 Tax=Rhizobium paranaense TaxID=1650438 RepID=A0A7W8XMI9_9HYPH|nr:MULTISPECIES: superoxide dismutase family protein [Rhizobium]MBB5571989.1 Cu-Zn family superoxide dismutase [Rhizobium paranaense]PST63092.1 superoxide dismutase [Rhizobium sp. SEMIA4064]
MRSILIAAALTLVAALPATAQDKQTAIANFVGLDGKQAGRAVLTEGKAGVMIELDVSGLPANRWVAFHIHENNHCDHTHGFESAGGHFNPTNAEHGLLAANGPHAGDMPNQYVDQDGKLRAQVFNGMVLLDGKSGIRGRTLMIHAESDDYRSQPVGGAGKRLACAVIE